MNIPLFTMARSGPGMLSTIARPRGGDWLDDEMASLRANAVTMLVSFLTPDEVSLLNLEDEQASAERAGIEYVSFPITDLSTSDIEPYKSLLQTTQTELHKGGHVVGHCRMGIGRA